MNHKHVTYLESAWTTALVGLLAAAILLLLSACIAEEEEAPASEAAPRQTVVVAEGLLNPKPSRSAPTTAPLPDCGPERVERFLEIIDGLITDAFLYGTMMDTASMGDLATLQTAYSGIVDTADWMTTTVRVFLADCGQSYGQSEVTVLRGLVDDLNADAAALRAMCRSDLAVLGIEC